MANEVAVSGKSEKEIDAFLDKIATAMENIVKSGLKAPSATLPGPIKLKTKAGEVYHRAMDDKYETQRAVGLVAAYALAGSEENARGHLVVTAPTGGSAGVMPALVYVLGEGGRKLPKEKIREGLPPRRSVISASTTPLAGASGCQAEIGGRPWARLSSPRPTTSPPGGRQRRESSLNTISASCDPVAASSGALHRGCAFGA
jgi:L-serine dehydratase